MMYKILLVEDDQTIVKMVSLALARWGYMVECVQDFGGVMEQFRRFAPHLVLLDIALPYCNGYHWCEKIRRESQTPVLFLSSSGDEMNQVMALSLGADDFLSKPFGTDLLIAKTEAILRRTYAFKKELTTLTLGAVTLNLGEAVLCYGANRLELTANEFRILTVLMGAAGEVVSRDALMQKLWQDDSFVDENTLTVNVSRLRKKLQEIGLESFIVTKNKLGYLVEGKSL